MFYVCVTWVRGNTTCIFLLINCDDCFPGCSLRILNAKGHSLISTVREQCTYKYTDVLMQKHKTKQVRQENMFQQKVYICNTFLCLTCRITKDTSGFGYRQVNLVKINSAIITPSINAKHLAFIFQSICFYVKNIHLTVLPQQLINQYSYSSLCF